MLYTTVKLSFNAAKRLLAYEGKCQQLHGYRHEIELSFIGDQAADLTVDFYLLQEKLCRWVDENWEHNVILNQEDRALGEAISAMTGQETFYTEGDPTAENLARYLKEKLCPSLFDGIKCHSVRVYDTEDTWVELKD